MSSTVAVLDIGSGNLCSAAKAFEHVGATTVITDDPDVALAADGLVVPGVGAFGSCWEGLKKVRGDAIIGTRLAGSRPVFGICIGMQLMFEGGVEYPFGEEDKDPLHTGDAPLTATPGMGEWPGIVERLDATVLPHMGWNTVEYAADSQIFRGLEADTRFYFVHSYAAQSWTMDTDPSGHLRPAQVSWSQHEQCRFVAAVENGPLVATQFHPEKSGDAGLTLLRNWVDTLSS